MVDDRERLKALAAEEVDAHRQELIDLSLRIHDNPETGLQEEKASAWLCDT
jgi:metal-dependent amidase/aminoacylase/carboxypeptidase family protein